MLKLIIEVSLRRPIFSRSPIRGETAAISASTAPTGSASTRVDLVKIGLELGQLIAGADLRAGDAEIKIDVRVHARQQLLQDEKVGIVAAVEGQHPASGRGSTCLKSGQRIEVARREDDVELLHQGTVLRSGRWLMPSRTAQVTRRYSAAKYPRRLPCRRTAEQSCPARRQRRRWFARAWSADVTLANVVRAS